MATTPKAALRYPVSSDSANIAQYFQNLATDVDTKVIVPVANQAARDALGLTGNLTVQRADTGDYESNYGGAWSRIAGPLMHAKVWRTAGFGPTPTAADAFETVDFNASRLSGGFTFNDADNKLAIPKSGHYEIRARGYASGGSGYSFRFRVMRARAATADRQAVVSGSGRKADTLDEQEYFGDTLPLQVGDELYMQASFSSTGGRYWGVDEGLGVQLSARYVGPLAGASPY